MIEKQTLRIEKIKACNENWFQMQGNDQVRFCSHCAKQVHAIESATPENIQAITEKMTGPVCIRMILPPRPTVKKTSQNIKIPHFLSGTMLVAGSVWAGQANVPAPAEPGWVQTDDTTSPTIPTLLDLKQGPYSVQGTVTEMRENQQHHSTGMPVAGVMIYLKDGCGQILGKVLSDEQGQYAFRGIPVGRFTLVCDEADQPSQQVIEFLTHEPRSRHFDIELGTFWVGEVGISADIVESWLFSSRDFYNHHHGTCSEEEWVNADRAFRAVNNAFFVSKIVTMALEKQANDLQLDPSELDPNGLDQEGISRFLYAVLARQMELAHQYLKRGAEVNGVTAAQVPYLLYAARMGDPEMVQAMLDHGADPNLTDKSGHTALMVAAYYGYQPVVDVLRKAGAQAGVKDLSGFDAAFYAKQNCK